MARLRYLITTLLLVAGLSRGVAQQQPLFTQYQFSSLAFNPGYVRNYDDLAVFGLHRTQWAGLEGAPSTQIISGAKPIDQNASLGFSLIRDQIGVSSRISLNAIYGYGIKLAKGELGIGIQASLINWSGDWASLELRDQSNIDPVYEDKSFSRFFFNTGAGIFYHTERFYFGFSAPYLLNNRLIDVEGSKANLQQHLYFATGYLIALNKGKQLYLKPNILLKGIGWLKPFFKEGEELFFKDAPTQFDLDLAIIYKNIMVGTTFRSSVERFTNQSSSLSSGSLWFSYHFNKGVRIGLAFDYSLTEIQQQQSGSFELLVGYELRPKSSKQAMPRYF